MQWRPQLKLNFKLRIKIHNFKSNNVYHYQKACKLELITLLPIQMHLISLKILIKDHDKTNTTYNHLKSLTIS